MVLVRKGRYSGAQAITVSEETFRGGSVCHGADGNVGAQAVMVSVKISGALRLHYVDGEVKGSGCQGAD